MPDLLTILRSRGLVHDATPGLPERLASTEPVSAYVGFDPTASSLHVGNLVPVMALSWLQRLGGLPIVVVGGGTGLVGDPSGKRGERPMLSVEEIDANVAALRKQLSRFLAFDGPAAARMVDNATWLRPLLLMEFLRDTGKHFTVNYMLQKESVSARMETGISFTEFAYMLVQAYDFHHLFTTEHCDLQMGGSDQWGNITAGIELIARRAGGKAHGLVCPLLTTSSGGKFGKSEGENIWLDPARTSPYRFYQFWLNTDDRDVERFLRIFTFLPLEEIEGLKQQHAANAGQRIPHRALADDLTDRVHGKDARQRVVAASAILFGGGSPRDADAETLKEVAQEVGIRDVGKRIDEGIPVVDALVEAQLATSKSDAMRGLKAGGFSVNGEKVQPDRVLIRSDLLAGGYILLQKGKKNYLMLHARS